MPGCGTSATPQFITMTMSRTSVVEQDQPARHEAHVRVDAALHVGYTNRTGNRLLMRM
ncbi:MAG: hypothetical protein ACLT98_09935 [Eggerthellaceae bacterium]